MPLDGSPLAQSALPYVTRLAQRFGSEVVLLRVVPPMTMVPLEHTGSFHLATSLQEEQKREADGYMQALAQQAALLAVRAQVLRREGEVVETILATANEISADTIVMTTHGRSGLTRRAIGSVAERVVSRASVPVVLIRAGGVPVEEPSAPPR